MLFRSPAVLDEILPRKERANSIAGKLNNHIAGVAVQALAGGNSRGLQRVSDVPIYTADAVVRRATALQLTSDAATPCVVMHSSELLKLGVQSGDTVKVSQGNASAHLVARADDGMPASAARVAAGHPATAGLGAMFGMIAVEPIDGERA